MDVVPHRELTRRLSSVRRTATPASTLPTVREINMFGLGSRLIAVCRRLAVCLLASESSRLGLSGTSVSHSTEIQQRASMCGIR